MRRTIRTIDAFYEATGPGAVPRDRARTIHEASATILSRYVGQVELSSVRGANIPIDGDALHPKQVRLGPADHTALLTNREVTGNSGSVKGVCDLTMTKKIVVRSKVLTNVLAPESDIMNATTIAANTHELVHSFGVDHCEGSGPCLMHPGLDYHDSAQNTAFLAGEPFCDPCIEDLEIAGNLALAHQIRPMTMSQV